MTQEMKGCPWCGQPATFEPFENCPGWGRMTLRHKDCFSKKETEEFPLPEEMAERWNLRVPDARDARIAELEAEVDRLQQRLAESTVGRAGGPILDLEALEAALAQPTPATPWYPDDSGEWVEVPDDLVVRLCPPGLRGDEMVTVLSRGERQRKDWKEDTEFAPVWDWDRPAGDPSRIVAYKVVK